MPTRPPNPRRPVESLERRTHLAAAPLIDGDGNDVSDRKAALAKGVNLSHVFWLPRHTYGTPLWEFKGWSATDAADGRADDDLTNDWEDYVRYAMPKREVQKIARAGFTYVRLPIDIDLLYQFDAAHPELGGSLDGSAMKLIRAKMREITDQGLAVVLAPFRTDNTTNSLDLQIWDARWQSLLTGALKALTRYLNRFPRDFDPDEVVLQPFNEPHLSEVWRAGYWEDGDWIVRDAQGEVALRLRPYADQPIGERTVTSAFWSPVQQTLFDAVRDADPGRRFTLLTSTPLDKQVVFKSGAELGDAIYALQENRNTVDGLFAEDALLATRDFDTTGALRHMGKAAVPRTTDGQVDRNVVYGLHYYANGIFSTQQGDYYSSDYALIYPLPLNPPRLVKGGQRVQFIGGTNLPRRDAPNGITIKYAQALDDMLRRVEQRLGIDRRGETLARSKWTASADDKAFIQDRRDAIAGDAADAAEVIRNVYLQQIVPHVARVFRYDIRNGTPTAIRDAVDVAQRWADETDLDPTRAGRQQPFVVVDEFGIRDHSWHLFGDTYRYVRPFEQAKPDRAAWIDTVRSAIDGSADDNGKYRNRMSWAAWDYQGEMSITDAETIDGAAPLLDGVPSADTVTYTNVPTYRRRLRKEIADALDVLPFGY